MTNVYMHSYFRSLGIQDCATSFTDCTDCDETELFDSHQEALCLVHGQSELVRAMAKGILEIIRSCQREFTGTKWNCTTFRGNHLFGSFVENGRCVCVCVCVCMCVCVSLS